MKIKEKFSKVIAAVVVFNLFCLALPVQTVRAALPNRVIGFKLWDSSTDTLVRQLTEGSEINLYVTPSFNIEAVVEDGGSGIGSVKFAINDVAIRTENVAPYASGGDTYPDFYPWTLAPGIYSLTATPYTKSNATGVAGDSLRVNFSVINDGEAPIITGAGDGTNYVAPVTPIIEGHSVALLNGEAFISGTQIPLNGIYELYAVDVWGNSITINFTINDIEAPLAPVHLSPADGTFITTADLQKIDWEDSVDPSAPVTYQFQSSNLQDVDVEGAFISPVYTSAWLPASEILTPGTPEGAYYWHVRAKDNQGNEGIWSEPWMITVDNTAPNFKDVEDIVTNIPKELTLEDIVDVDDSLAFNWSELTGKVKFGDLPNSTATLSATEDGVYDISVEVKDSAGNSTTKTFKFTWDATVNPVKDLYVLQGEGFVDLHWTNPDDLDLAKVKILRSIAGESTWYELAELTHGEVLYQDEAVLDGVNYLYKVVTLDELGNQAYAEVAGTPQLALVTPEPTVQNYTYGYSSNAPKEEVKGEEKEVKSDEDQNEEDQNEEARTLPAVGIGILVLLALVGIYLLYLQNPKWFGFLKKKKNNVKKLK